MVTVQVIEETGATNHRHVVDNLYVSRGPRRFDEVSDLTESEDESWRPEKDNPAGLSSANTSMETVSPNETKDLITDLIDNEDINPTALFTYSTKRNKHNIT